MEEESGKLTSALPAYIQEYTEWVRAVGSRGKNLEIEMGRKKSLQACEERAGKI